MEKHKYKSELSKKDIWMYSIASFVIIVCWAITIIGLYLPPPGQIHSSVLVALGQGILFVATIFGVSYYVKNELGTFTNYIIDKVKNKDFDKKEEEIEIVEDK